MRGGVDVGRTQIRHQQMMAAENIQRQEAILVVVSVEEAVDLVAVNRVVGGIKVEYQFFGSDACDAMKTSTKTLAMSASV